MAIDTAELFTRLGRYGRLLVAAHAGQAELPAAFLSLYAEMGAAYPDLDGSVAAQEDASVRGLTGWWGRRGSRASGSSGCSWAHCRRSPPAPRTVHARPR